MDLKVNDDWRITSDPHNFILQRSFVSGPKSKTPGKVSWKSEYFYGTLDAAFRGLLRKSMMDSDATCIQELQAVIDSLNADIDSMLLKLPSEVRL